MKQRNAFTLVELLVVIAIIGVLLAALDPAGGFFYLLFGWMRGTYHLVAGLHHEPLAVGIGVAALVLLPFAVHSLVRRLLADPGRWKFRQSVAVCGLACSLIIATIGMITFVHELYWFRHPAQPITINIRMRFQISDSVIHTGRGVCEFAEKHEDALPAGGTVLKDDRSGHGWMAHLLPYVEEKELFEKIDWEKPWDDPANAPVFQGETPRDFKAAGRWGRGYKDASEFALTDIAANERVMPFGRSLRLSDITDGTSRTILCGEVGENLSPWGSPFNSRDPALGLNASPHGFGNSIRGYHVVHFAMCDGSVARISNDIGPEVLRELATPDGGEADRSPLTEYNHATP